MNNNQRIGLTFSNDGVQQQSSECLALQTIKVDGDYVATYKNEKGGLLIGYYKTLEEAKEFLKGLL